METTKRTMTEVSNIKFGYWDADADKFVPLECTNETLSMAAKKLNCSTELLEAIDMFVAVVKDHISADLISIWERLDKAGIP